jgi:sigma-B regulation protein RsbU (phosphoserine phosphatase)
MIYGVLDTETKELRYVSAGHPGPLLQRHGGKTELLEATSVPVGLIEGAQYQEATLQLRQGDRLFLFTDGLTESTNADGQEFGDELLIRKLDTYEDMEIAEAVQRLMKDVEDWRGECPMRDDTSVLGMQVEVNVNVNVNVSDCRSSEAESECPLARWAV